jgi:hypothetical protein
MILPDKYRRVGLQGFVRFFVSNIHAYNSMTRGKAYANKMSHAILSSYRTLAKGETVIYPVHQTAMALNKKYKGAPMPRPNYSAANFKGDSSVPKVKMAGAFYGHVNGQMYNNYATRREILKKAYRQVGVDVARTARKGGLDELATKALLSQNMNRVKNGIRAVSTVQQSFYIERNIRGKIAGITNWLGFADYNKGVARGIRAEYRAKLELMDTKIIKYTPKAQTNMIREIQGGQNMKNLLYIRRRAGLMVSAVGHHFQQHGLKYAIAGAAIGAGIVAYRNRATIARYATDHRVVASLHNLRDKSIVGAGFAVAGHFVAKSNNPIMQFGGRVLQGVGAGLITGALAHTTHVVMGKSKADEKLARKQAAKTVKTPVERLVWNKHISDAKKASTKINHSKK